MSLGPKARSKGGILAAEPDIKGLLKLWIHKDQLMALKVALTRQEGGAPPRHATPPLRRGEATAAAAASEAARRKQEGDTEKMAGGR